MASRKTCNGCGETRQQFAYQNGRGHKFCAGCCEATVPTDYSWRWKDENGQEWDDGDYCTLETAGSPQPQEEPGA